MTILLLLLAPFLVLALFVIFLQLFFIKNRSVVNKRLHSCKHIYNKLDILNQKHQSIIVCSLCSNPMGKVSGSIEKER